MQKKFYCLANGRIFRGILGNQDNALYLADFLEKLLDIKKEDLEGLTIFNNIKLNKKKFWAEFLDIGVYVKLKNGMRILLKMNETPYVDGEFVETGDFQRRLFVGLDVYDLPEDSWYRKNIANSLPSSIKEENRVVEYNLEIPQNALEPVTIKTCIVNIDKKEDEIDDDLSEELKLWIKLLRCETKEELEVLAKENEIIKGVVEKIIKLNKII